MTYKFILFVAGKESKKNRQIIETINDGLVVRLKDAFTLTVVDVIKSPEAALKEQIFVTPSWVRSSPVPKKKIIGNFSVEKNVSHGLDIFMS
jgi:circadian clock protein KaiB